MIRINPAIHKNVIKKEGTETMLMKGRECIGYVCINNQELKTKADLEFWIKLALDFNEIAKASKKK